MTAVEDIRAMGDAYIEMARALINTSEANRDSRKMVEDMLYSKDSVSVTNRLNPVVVERYEKARAFFQLKTTAYGDELAVRIPQEAPGVRERFDAFTKIIKE